MCPPVRDRGRHRPGILVGGGFLDRVLRLVLLSDGRIQGRPITIEDCWFILIGPHLVVRFVIVGVIPGLGGSATQPTGRLNHCSEHLMRAFLLSRDDDKVVSHAIVDLTDDDLPEGEVTVAVEYSTINYKRRTTQRSPPPCWVTLPAPTPCSAPPAAP